MNNYIPENARGFEVGAGCGFSKDYIKSNNYALSDYTTFDWLDYKNIDALATGFADNSFDFIVSSNMIHHLPYPIRFFEEMHRILKPNGKILIQEINGSYLMRFVLKLMKHEGYNFNTDVWDANNICTDPNDLWSANCVIPNLLFDNMQKFEKEVPFFKCTYHKYTETFLLLNSGGVIAKTTYIPLNNFFLKIVAGLDKFLGKIAPRFFSLQRQIVLQKV
jgi:SAM-dependent methyltransferase